jgi:hypothetical protein
MTTALVTTAPQLTGLRVRLDRTIDVPCITCGETVVVIGEGTGPHAASLRCSNCDRHRGWLPRAIASFLSETVRSFGVPDEPPLIRDALNLNLKGAEMKRAELFPSRFLKHPDLQGRPQVAIIKDVIREDVGDEAKQKPVIYFRGKEKGFVCNATNYDIIADAYGDETDDWAGQPIELYPTRVPFKGQLTDTIRVRIPSAKSTPAREPAPKPAPVARTLDDDIPF